MAKVYSAALHRVIEVDDGKIQKSNTSTNASPTQRNAAKKAPTPPSKTPTKTKSATKSKTYPQSGIGSRTGDKGVSPPNTGSRPTSSSSQSGSAAPSFSASPAAAAARRAARVSANKPASPAPPKTIVISGGQKYTYDASTNTYVPQNGGTRLTRDYALRLYAKQQAAQRLKSTSKNAATQGLNQGRPQLIVKQEGKSGELEATPNTVAYMGESRFRYDASSGTWINVDEPNWRVSAYDMWVQQQKGRVTLNPLKAKYFHRPTGSNDQATAKNLQEAAQLAKRLGFKGDMITITNPVTGKKETYARPQDKYEAGAITRTLEKQVVAYNLKAEAENNKLMAEAAQSQVPKGYAYDPVTSKLIRMDRAEIERKVKEHFAESEYGTDLQHLNPAQQRALEISAQKGIIKKWVDRIMAAGQDKYIAPGEAAVIKGTIGIPQKWNEKKLEQNEEQFLNSDKAKAYRALKQKYGRASIKQKGNSFLVTTANGQQIEWRMQNGILVGRRISGSANVQPASPFVSTKQSVKQAQQEQQDIYQKLNAGPLHVGGSLIQETNTISEESAQESLLPQGVSNEAAKQISQSFSQKGITVTKVVNTPSGVYIEGTSEGHVFRYNGNINPQNGQYEFTGQYTNEITEKPRLVTPTQPQKKEPKRTGVAKSLREAYEKIDTQALAAQNKAKEIANNAWGPFKAVGRWEAEYMAPVAIGVVALGSKAAVTAAAGPAYVLEQGAQAVGKVRKYGAKKANLLQTTQLSNGVYLNKKVNTGAGPESTQLFAEVGGQGKQVVKGMVDWVVNPSTQGGVMYSLKESGKAVMSGKLGQALYYGSGALFDLALVGEMAKGAKETVAEAGKPIAEKAYATAKEKGIIKETKASNLYVDEDSGRIIKGETKKYSMNIGGKKIGEVEKVSNTVIENNLKVSAKPNAEERVVPIKQLGEEVGVETSLKGAVHLKEGDIAGIYKSVKEPVEYRETSVRIKAGKFEKEILTHSSTTLSPKQEGVVVYNPKEDTTYTLGKKGESVSVKGISKETPDLVNKLVVSQEAKGTVVGEQDITALKKPSTFYKTDVLKGESEIYKNNNPLLKTLQRQQEGIDAVYKLSGSEGSSKYYLSSGTLSEKVVEGSATPEEKMAKAYSLSRRRYGEAILEKTANKGIGITDIKGIEEPKAIVEVKVVKEPTEEEGIKQTLIKRKNRDISRGGELLKTKQDEIIENAPFKDIELVKRKLASGVEVAKREGSGLAEVEKEKASPLTLQKGTKESLASGLFKGVTKLIPKSAPVAGAGAIAAARTSQKKKYILAPVGKSNRKARSKQKVGLAPKVIGQIRTVSGLSVFGKGKIKGKLVLLPQSTQLQPMKLVPPTVTTKPLVKTTTAPTSKTPLFPLAPPISGGTSPESPFIAGGGGGLPLLGGGFFKNPFGSSEQGQKKIASDISGILTKSVTGKVKNVKQKKMFSGLVRRYVRNKSGL